MLTTKAECDEALAGLAAELETYQHRNDNLDYAAGQAGRSLGDVTARLAGVQAEIDSYTAMLNVPNMPSSLKKQTESRLRRAHDRKDNLSERHPGPHGQPRLPGRRRCRAGSRPGGDPHRRPAGRGHPQGRAARVGNSSFLV
ncbi:MAG: hypothetical protein WKG07_29475 [Hymenobacter sp.]